MSDESHKRRVPIRWVTLAEVLGIAAVVISGLTLWNNMSERESAEAARAAEQQALAAKSSARARTERLVTLEGIADPNGERLALSDANHRITRIAVAFPPSLAVPVQSNVLDTRIAHDWFAGPVLKAIDGGPDAVEGRLPVVITSSYWDGEVERTDRSLYEVVFTTQGQLLGGRSLKLKGLVLRDRRPPAEASALLDRLWQAEVQRILPKTPSKGA